MALEVNFFKGNSNDSTTQKYFIEIIENDTGEVIDVLEYTSKDDFDSWKEQAESSGEYVDFIECVSPFYDQSNPSPESAAGGLEPLPTPPASDAPPEEISAYREQLSGRNLCIGLGEEPADPPPIDSNTSEEDLEEASRAADSATNVDDVLGSGPDAIEDTSPEVNFEPESSNESTPVLNYPRNNPPPAGSRGLMGEPLYEEYPKYIMAAADKGFFGLNNTSIVLGRDRPGSLLTGYGHGLEPQTGAGAIDIVAGRMSPYPKRYTKREGKEIRINPIFNQDIDDEGRVIMDAARIYISQKADIDDYFNINTGDGSVGIGNIKTRSAIALKADAVRVISRSGGIKLVTQERGLGDSVFSGPNVVKEPRGIDLIAGNEVEFLQPMVMGENLRVFLQEVLEAISSVVGTVTDVENQLQQLSSVLMFHTHPQIGLETAIPTAFSPEVAAVCASIGVQGVSKTLFSVFAEKWDSNSLRTNYLETGAPRETSILSKFNNVN